MKSSYQTPTSVGMSVGVSWIGYRKCVAGQKYSNISESIHMSTCFKAFTVSTPIVHTARLQSTPRADPGHPLYWLRGLGLR